MQALQRITRGALGAAALGVGLFATAVALPAAAQPGHHHGGGDQFMARLAEVKSQLNLDASQQALWDSAAASGKAAREVARALRATVHQVVTEEAAKPTPDLARIAAARDKAQDSSTTDRRAVRDQWLKLYATFRPDQVAVVKTILATRLSRMEAFKERMKRHLGQ